MRIVGPIQFLRGCMIYLLKKKAVDTSTRTHPRVQTSTRPRDGSTRGRWTLCTHPPFLGLHACNKMDAWPVDGPILLHARAYLIKRKKIAWEGDTQTDKQTNRWKSQLYDQIGPVGQFDENQISLLYPFTQRLCIFKSAGLSHDLLRTF